MRRARVGELKLRFAIERPVDAADDIGGVSRTWAGVATVWGRLETPGGEAAFIAQRPESAISHGIVIRWRADVTAAMRLRLGARVFVINAATDADGRRRFLCLQCDEIA